MTDLRTPPVNDGDLFSERARQYAYEKPLQRVHILEAGCGWGRGLDLGDRDHQVTGVDMDTPALRAHTRARSDLDAWHLGDLRTVPMPPRAYDIVHASYLIERVPNAELVLDRFVAALKPGGLLLVRLRDRNTAFGFLDRKLPTWLRGPVWSRLGARDTAEEPPDDAARTAEPQTSASQATATHAAGPPAIAWPTGPVEARLAALGISPTPPPETARAIPPETGPATAAEAESKAEADRPDAPPPAIYEKVASRQGMQWYCVMRGLVIAEEYASRESVDALAAGTGLAGGLCRLVSAVSRGRLTAEHSEMTLVIRKPENRFARVI